MATKSFQTDFKFTSKTAGALANALQHSKRVDVKINQRVTRYSTPKVANTNKFDAFFGSPKKGVEDGR